MLLPFLHGIHRCFRIDEAIAIELAVAFADQVEELTAERHAAIEGAEEARAARDQLSGRNRHTAAEQVGRVATSRRAGTRRVAFITIHTERQQVAAAEAARTEVEIQLFPLAGQARR